MELITSGTKFYLNGQNLYGLKSTPDMGGSREKKQVTNLLDTAHRYIAGLYKYDELTFGFYYNSDSDNPNVSSGQVAAAYSAARAIERAGTSVSQKLEFPDGTYFTWTGQISTRIKSMNPDGIMEFSIISIPDTKLVHSLDN